MPIMLDNRIFLCFTTLRSNPHRRRDMNIPWTFPSPDSKSAVTAVFHIMGFELEQLELNSESNDEGEERYTHPYLRDLSVTGSSKRNSFWPSEAICCVTVFWNGNADECERHILKKDVYKRYFFTTTGRVLVYEAKAADSIFGDPQPESVGTMTRDLEWPQGMYSVLVATMSGIQFLRERLNSHVEHANARLSEVRTLFGEAVAC